VKALLHTVAVFGFAMLVTVARAQSVDNQITTRPGRMATLDFFYSVYPNCSSRGEPRVQVTSYPENGGFFVATRDRHPKFPLGSNLHKCNARRVPSTVLYYKSNQQYIGNDTVSVEVIYPDGSQTDVNYSITVK
jgi:hypothetical protein